MGPSREASILAVAQTRSVMVVEDYADARELRSAALETEGYGVLLAENGRDALDVALRDHPRHRVYGLSQASGGRRRAVRRDLREAVLTRSTNPPAREGAPAAGWTQYSVTDPERTSAR